MKSFENKVVVVTGGAHGIGATVVSEFEKEGAKVAYIDGGMTRQMVYHNDCGWKFEG